MSDLCACAWCGKEFRPSRSDGLFHSKPCKQAYWRWKHRLNYLQSVAYNAIEEIEQYLEYPFKEKEAQNVLGLLADKLHALGFEHDQVQLELPEDSYTISNQLGE
jgi:hypothetical protein